MGFNPHRDPQRPRNRNHRLRHVKTPAQVGPVSAFSRRRQVCGIRSNTPAIPAVRVRPLPPSPKTGKSRPESRDVARRNKVRKRELNDELDHDRRRCSEQQIQCALFDHPKWRAVHDRPIFRWQNRRSLSEQTQEQQARPILRLARAPSCFQSQFNTVPFRPETIRRALCRDSQGRASGPLGAALDIITGG
jgi:hypothetical protein